MLTKSKGVPVGAAPSGSDGSLCHSIAETCERLGISRSMLYGLLEWGHIECIHIGSRALIPDAEVQRFIATMQFVEQINRALAQQGRGYRVEIRKSQLRNHGLYFVLDAEGKLINADVKLDELAQSLNVRQGDESRPRAAVAA